MTFEEAQRRLPPVWVIYRFPREYPAKWVIRIWWGMHPSPQAYLYDSIEEARASIPRSAIKLMPSDDLGIFESWL